MQVLVMFSQCRAFVYAQSQKCKPRFCLKKPIPFSPDSNVFKDNRCFIIVRWFLL